jgi:trans-2,3-dihydro-3-hydroxyanthranilate isomerase
VLSYDVVDVFTERPYAGNPLAVVHGGAELTTGQMQRIAGEFNLSETVFPLPPTTPEADYRVRIFTPGRELPFAGHPSVGVAWVLARAGLIEHGDVVQECGAGLLPVVVTEYGAQVTGGAPEVGPALDGATLAAAVGLGRADVDDAVPAGIAGAGVPYAFLAVHDGAVARAVPDPAAVRAATEGLVGLTVVTYDRAGSAAHMRMFAPGPVSRRTRRPGRRPSRSACSSSTAGCSPPTGRPGSWRRRARSWAARRSWGCWCTPMRVRRCARRCGATSSPWPGASWWRCPDRSSTLLTKRKISSYSCPMRRRAGELVPLEAEILTAALALRRNGEDRFHGFQLAKLLAEADGARTLTAHGTLYKALGRLEAAGMLASVWEEPDDAAAEGRPRRRLYAVTGSAERAVATSRAGQRTGVARAPRAGLEPT